MFLDESEVVKSTATVIHKAVHSLFRRHLVYDDTDPLAAIPAIPAQDWVAREVVHTKHRESGSDSSEEEDSDEIDSALDLE